MASSSDPSSDPSSSASSSPSSSASSDPSSSSSSDPSSSCSSSSPPPPYTASEPDSQESAYNDISQFQGGYIQFDMLKDTNVSVWRAGTPKRNEYVAGQVPWHAVLTLHVKDVSQMMTGGVHLSSENIDPRGALISNRGIHLSTYCKSLGWTHYRRYALRHLQDGNPQWKGIMIVRSGSVKELSRFRFDDLSIKNIRMVRAFVRSVNQVYFFDCIDANKNFNALFDDMPMHGWWPWPNPKAEKGDDTDERQATRSEASSDNHDYWDGDASLQPWGEEDRAWNLCGFEVIVRASRSWFAL
ncbi:hypothetical protein C2857_004396 [Epichloe festucae Fl1]|uniref:Uncharacterized protein n=1 Tax=Epichloe festucae (strain Fl1) TaxID=877507 RepID=A0A7U3Q3K0_EPIFF|nr:hypothetical protein C2857_004396 [Epichloe festucae Fl1]